MARDFHHSMALSESCKIIDLKGITLSLTQSQYDGLRKDNVKDL